MLYDCWKMCCIIGDISLAEEVVMCGAVAQWLENHILSQEYLGLNLLATILKLGQFRSPHIASVHSAV